MGRVLHELVNKIQQGGMGYGATVSLSVGLVANQGSKPMEGLQYLAEN